MDHETDDASREEKSSKEHSAESISLDWSILEPVSNSVPPVADSSQRLEATNQILGEQPPVRWREIVVVLLLVILCDVTIYRAEGFSGSALLFFLGPILLAIGSPKRSYSSWTLWSLGCLLTILAAAMAWCGSGLQVLVGVCLTCAFALTRSGGCPFVLDTLLYPFRALYGGIVGLVHYGHSVCWPGQRLSSIRFLNVILPMLAFLTFSFLFLLANPDLFEVFGARLDRVLNAARDWVIKLSPPLSEIGFWVAVAWIAIGSMRPHVLAPVVADVVEGVASESHNQSDCGQAALYAACRNTLITVIALFAGYLVFELQTLWFRVFPVGFYYSGYAHQGAAWLTVALGLTTVILSLVFRGQILQDSRVKTLKLLAWTWSLLNLLLAVAVYHRLNIYIDFNGLTRMRIIGFFGMSAVLAGFLLVLWKIARSRSFLWLIHRHLWTLAVAVYLFAVTPVDVLVVSYNVRRVLAGDLAPSVQISVHEIDSAGFRLLRPLLACPDEKIREGVRALLAERQVAAEALASRREPQNWTSFQWSDQVLLQELRDNDDDWSMYQDRRCRDKVLEQFHSYVYQWY